MIAGFGLKRKEEPSRKKFDLGLKRKSKDLAAFERFVELLPDVTVEEATDVLGADDPVVWTMRARRLKGHPLVFDVEKELRAALDKMPKIPSPEDIAKLRNLQIRHRPFLIEPLRDQHKHKVYMKARQIGVSELSLTEVLHFLDSNPSTKAIYTFPREAQLQTFSETRIKEALKETPYMRNLITATDKVSQKTVGKGSHLILRSAWEANLGEGVDADAVFLDEKDRMKPGIDAAFTESLSSSPFGFLRELSTPTLPGVGVSASFERSDQRCWFVKCLRCGALQTIDYPENVVQLKDHDRSGEMDDDAYAYLCRKTNCRGELDRLHGQWVARYPSRKDVRGYHMPQMIAPWITATAIARKRAKAKILSTFDNYVLGITSKGEHILLTDMDFNKCSGNYSVVSQRDPKNWDLISIGIDWGNRSWVVVLGRNAHNMKPYLLNAFYIDDDPNSELMSVNLLVPHINVYDASIVVADAGYGRDRNTKLARLFPGRFFACQYNTSKSGSRAVQPAWSDTTGKVLVDRTATLKMTCKALKEREVGILKEGALPLMADFRAHLKALAPINVEDDDGVIHEEIQRTGPDHLAHAFNYAYLGLDKLTHGSAFNFDFVAIL